MSKRKKIKSKNLKKNIPSQEHINYLNFMSFFWVSSAIAQIIIVILMIPYYDKITIIIDENKGSLIVYLAIYIIWSYYRINSRLKYRNMPNFQEKMTADFTFAKKFNNREIIKTLISYFLFAIPIFYIFEIAQNILKYFGYNSNGFGSDVQNLMISIVSSIGPIAIGISINYLYDKIKHKLP